MRALGVPEGGVAAVALAQPGKGFMKIDGKLEAFAPDAGSGDRIVRYHAEDEGDEATWVAGTASQLHADDAVNWREIAVLYRTNAQSRVIEEAFMRLGVPYKVVGGTRFYDRREVKDAMAYLRAVVNPVDEVSVKRVLNVPKRGVGDASIAKLDASRQKMGAAMYEAAAADASAAGGSTGATGEADDDVVDAEIVDEGPAGDDSAAGSSDAASGDEAK